MDSPVRLRVSPHFPSPTGGLYSRRFWIFSFPVSQPCLAHVVCCLVTHPLCLAAHLHPSSQFGWLFFFNSFVVRVPCSLICRQFWLLFVFKLVVILPLVVLGSKAFLPASPSLLELLNYLYLPPDLPQLPSVNQSKILPLPSDNLLKPNWHLCTGNNFMLLSHFKASPHT